MSEKTTDSLQNPLLPVLINRLSRDDQIAPKFVGKFSDLSELPKQSYPPIYWWFNTSIKKPVLSLNTPLLLDICKSECAKSDISFDETVADVASHAIEILNSVSYRSFEESWPSYQAELNASEKKSWMARIRGVFK